MKPTSAWMKSYDLPGWAGGIAVFITSSEHGAKIVSIPRLGLSTCLIGGNDVYDLDRMLMQDRTMYNNPEEQEFFINMIVRDIRNIG